MNNTEKYLSADEIYYVYKLINPIDDQIFYIGSGKGDRMNVHWRGFLKSGIKSCRNNNFKFSVLNKIKEAGLIPIAKAITKSNLLPHLAEKIETMFILNIGRLCNNTGPLVNIKTHQRCPMRDPETATKVKNSLRKFYDSEEGKIYLKQKAFDTKEKGTVAGENNPMWGYEWTEEQRKNQSVKMKGKNKGIKRSSETCAKLSKITKGINRIKNKILRQGGTEEDYKEFVRKQNETQSINNRGDRNPNFGNKWSEEQKENLRLKKIGHKANEKTKLKQSIAHKGKKKSKQHCENMSKVRKGKSFHTEKQKEEQSKRLKELFKDKSKHPRTGTKHSEETRDKLKAAWVIRRQKNSKLS